METGLESETQASIAKRRKEKWRHTFTQFVFAGLFAASMLFPEALSLGSGTGAKLLSAGLPILVLTAWTWALVAHIRKLEEFEQTLAVNSLAITFGALLWAITCYEIITIFWQGPSFPAVLLVPVAIVIWHVIWEFLRHRFI